MLHPPVVKDIGKSPSRVNWQDSNIEIWFLYGLSESPPKIIILPFIVAEHDQVDSVSLPKVKWSITVSFSEMINWKTTQDGDVLT